ncbi:hypothetical protein CGCSCA1_v008413 [Colletotrichum siamense]|nr:hypothetical protein CGCSCA1_v008413 [Colletotrichum siamense]
MRILVAKSSLGKRPALYFLALPNKSTRETKQLFFSNTALFLPLTHVSNHGRRIALVRLLNCELSFFPCLRITHVTLLSDSLGSRTVPRHIIFFSFPSLNSPLAVLLIQSYATESLFPDRLLLFRGIPSLIVPPADYFFPT